MTPTVLIADDDADVVDLLARRCRSVGLNVETASDAFTALSTAETCRPDAAILDVNMPCGSGLTVCEFMAEHADLRSIPVVILTAAENETTIRRCHEMCAYYVLKCPDVWSRVEPVLREVLDLPEPQKTSMSTSRNTPQSHDTRRGPVELMDSVFALLGVEDGAPLVDDACAAAEPRTDDLWVLSIEDDEDVALALRMRLQEYGVRVIRATAGDTGYRQAFLNSPRAIILDYELPAGNGDFVLRRLKETRATCDIPVIVLTGRREASIERQMRSLGASEFLTKPLNWSQLKAALDLHLTACP